LRDYELVFIISPEVPEEEVPTAIERVSGFITGQGGEVREVERWGRRRLAYPIRRHVEGNYVVTQLRLERDQVAPLEASLGLNEEVIRHLLVRVEEGLPA
jgi:small subunit ribosomal protein S6